MTIKHLVFSGGGPAGLVLYGAAKQLNNVYWNLNNIESIYGTSIGAFIGIIISLGYDWDVVDDYLIKRPWNNNLNIEPFTVINAYHTKGLINQTFITDAILPLLEAKGLNVDTTFKDLYEYNKIDIHIFTTNLNGEQMSNVDISYKTHPDLSVIKGISMTTAYPFIFCPVIEDGNCYVDGGVLNNFPIVDCYNNNQCDEKEILAFNSWTTTTTATTATNNLRDDSTLFDYFIILFKKINREIRSETMEISNLVKCDIDITKGFQCWIDTIESQDYREELINTGVEKADIYIHSKIINGNENICLPSQEPIIGNNSDISNNHMI